MEMATVSKDKNRSFLFIRCTAFTTLQLALEFGPVLLCSTLRKELHCLTAELSMLWQPHL